MATETEVGELLHQRGWRTAFTVAERVNAWAALVSVIERGYGDDIYEYTNDLYCRNWLHEAWLPLDEHIVQLWTPKIKALDDRYKAATVDDDGQALDQFHRLPGPELWWWRRHPRILTGDLGRSLRSVGAIGTDSDTSWPSAPWVTGQVLGTRKTRPPPIVIQPSMVGVVEFIRNSIKE
ncbi:hypothetical protein ACIRPQ_07345 [Streptomyces sp. NPDC101213]|uniref:hypothetical protein n=1 Tax=unclassified Streptomyces TaxID=2593676 RepID=UPI0036FCC9A3